MTPYHHRSSSSSISAVGPITPKSYIFGYDIIHNSSINSTSHFLSVSLTFLTLSPSIPSFLPQNHSSFTPTPPPPCMSALSSLPVASHHSPFSSPILVGFCVIYRVIQSGARFIDCLSEGGDLSGGGGEWFDAFFFWLVTGSEHKDIIC